MPPLLSLRVPLLWLCWLVAACSTPISPYSPLADEDEAQEELPVVDAGSVRDSGVREAGARDAGTTPPNCGRIADANYYVMLIDDDCALRTARACAAPGQSPQVVTNQLLMSAATRCGVPASVALGVAFGPSGCPRYFGANGADLGGRVSQCLQDEFETWRLSCSLSCVGIGAFAR